MKVRIRFLSTFREIVGSSEKLLELPEGSPVGSLLEEIHRQFPRLGDNRDQMFVSINRKKVTDLQVLHEGDEVVLFPPSVGG